MHNNAPSYPSLKSIIVVKKRKIFRILILLVLLPGILIKGAMTEACLCIQPCSFGLQDERDTNENGAFHGHHASRHCKSCNIEDGQTLKAAVASTSIGNAKVLDKPLILFILSDSHPNKQIHKSFVTQLYNGRIIQSSPTYLLNLCILC